MIAKKILKEAIKKAKEDIKMYDKYTDGMRKELKKLEEALAEL